MNVLLYAAAAVLGLVVLIARFKVHAFLAIILASLFVGMASGMKLAEIGRAFQEGVGSTLGFIAVVVGLGTMLGRMLAESGGADVVAQGFMRTLGPGRIHWTLMLVGFVVGLPVFFGVGLVLLVPILFTLARRHKLPLLLLGIPVTAGLSVSHGLVPPHPGPLIAIEQLGADPGRMIFYAVVVGLPTAVIAGPIFGKFMAQSRWVGPVELGGIGLELARRGEREWSDGSTGLKPGGMEWQGQQEASPNHSSTPALHHSNPPSFHLGSSGKRSPSLGITLFTILLPVGLMLLATLADLTLDKDNRLRGWADFVGSPLISMTLAVLISFYTFGAACGFNPSQILRFTEDCIGPAAGIFLVVGAGGGFSKILDASGVDTAIIGLVQRLDLPILLLGWLVAAAIRVAVGSATVSITMASALMAPVAATVPGTSPELLALALGAGSLVLSHLNDGGFWFVKEYLNLTVAQTLKTWTVMETIISFVALALVLALDRLV